MTWIRVFSALKGFVVALLYCFLNGEVRVILSSFSGVGIWLESRGGQRGAR